MMRTKLLAVVCLLVIVAGYGCGGGGEPSALDNGTQLLGGIIGESTASGEPPSAAELDQAVGLFEQAVEEDPSNPQALFGLAVTMVAEASTRFYEDHPELFPADGAPSLVGVTGLASSTARALRSTGLLDDLLRPAALKERVNDLLVAPARLCKGLGQARAFPSATQLANAQQHLETYVIPRVEEALTHLDALEADPDFPHFQFPITITYPQTESKMVIIIDQGDVLLFDGLVSATDASLHLLCAYEVNYGGTPPNYEEINALDANHDRLLHVSEYVAAGDFLTLRSTGQAHTSDALDYLGRAVDRGIGGLEATLAEPEDNGDILAWHGDPELQASLEDTLQQLQTVQPALEGQADVQVEIEEGVWVTVTIDLPAFFGSAPTDLKPLLPVLGYHIYTVATETGTERLVQPFPVEFPDSTFDGLFPAGLPAEVLDLPGAPVAVEIDPATVEPLAVGGAVDLIYNAYDADWHPAHLSPESMHWSGGEMVGTLSVNGVFQRFTATGTGSDMVTVEMTLPPYDSADVTIQVTE